MGADLLMISIPGFMPNPERRNRIVALIAECTEIPEEVIDILGCDDADPAQTREAWEYAVLDAFDALDGSREIATVATHSDRSWVYVTGGFSHGDDPSDYYQGFSLMHYGEILEEMQKWATEDRAAKE